MLNVSVGDQSHPDVTETRGDPSPLKSTGEKREPELRRPADVLLCPCLSCSLFSHFDSDLPLSAFTVAPRTTQVQTTPVQLCVGFFFNKYKNTHVDHRM